MATQVNIDLANIGQQIAAAVKEAVEQATDKLLAVTLKEIKDEKIRGGKIKGEEVKATSNQDFSFDIRGQILANAQWLYTISKIYYIQDTTPDSTAGPASPSPPLYILIKSTDELYEAEVRLQLPRDDRHIHYWGFLESAIAGSAEEALRKLLRLTTELLGADGEYGEDYAWRTALDEENIVDVEGLGFMWAPSGGCDGCEDGVW
ncbi:hypothetical protein LTR27_008360 [Elasticomyces elasticus]|nr:hypothetical protein LTR27_008360 [Elasticomyces elasticus]